MRLPVWYETGLNHSVERGEMSMALNESVASLSLENFLPKDGAAEVSLGELYKALDRLVNTAVSKRNINPNELVRVVDNGKVSWITARQAQRYLESDAQSGDGLREKVERALKGDARILHQELRVLLAIAAGTFENLNDEGLIDEKEEERIRLSIRRRESEISDTFTQLYEVEGRISAARARQPLIAEYENRMGQLLNLQSQGKMDEARELARYLAMEKKKYVLMSHAIEPDVYTAYFHRLNAQKTRKKTLNLQQNLCQKKEGAIGLRIDQLHARMETIENRINLADTTTATDPTQAEIALRAKEELLLANHEIKQASDQLAAVQTETQVLVKQEKEAQMVIEHIATNVLKDQELAIDVESQVKNIEQRRKSQPTKPPEKPKTELRGRMATTERHQ